MKTYIQPQVMIVKLTINHVVAASTLGIDNSTTNKVTDVNDLLGRESNAWDIWGSDDNE